MKALLDEQLSAEIAELLRSRGHDVQAVTEREELVQSSDEEVMEVAARERRAVVTNNVKDYRPIAARRLADRRGHPGLILLSSRRSRTRDATGLIADAVELIMRANANGIADSETWVPPFELPPA